MRGLNAWYESYNVYRVIGIITIYTYYILLARTKNNSTMTFCTLTVCLYSSCRKLDLKKCARYITYLGSWSRRATTVVVGAMSRFINIYCS